MNQDQKQLIEAQEAELQTQTGRQKVRRTLARVAGDCDQMTARLRATFEGKTTTEIMLVMEQVSAELADMVQANLALLMYADAAIVTLSEYATRAIDANLAELERGDS